MSGEAVWQPVIGLEIHVQLATQSKAFSSSAVRFGAGSNELTDPVVLGLPGALPVYNGHALELAIRIGLACGCEIAPRSRFARKHYFYPDLPKGYQISQFEDPVCIGGAIDYWFDGQAHQLQLTRIHVEEDAGKNMHRGQVSLVDLNRAGVPLCEIVSEPELHSAEHAGAVLRALRNLVRWLGVGDGDMEKGQMRCDANVSIRPQGSDELQTRTELKNINSFRFVEEAIRNEIGRQISIVTGGGTVVSETRLWDADAGVSRTMRGKEEAEDYRYLPDPDLPPLLIDDQTVNKARQALPELPRQARARYLEEFKLPEEMAATLLADRNLAEYFDQAVVRTGPSKASVVANWLLIELTGELNRRDLSLATSTVSAQQLAELVELINDGTISGKIGKSVLSQMLDTGEGAPVIVEREGLTQVSDAGAIEALVDEVIAANPKQVEQFRGGNTKLIGFFVGQVMKASSGKANPKLVNEVLQKKLS